jgi:Ca-activated chloride channel family protein
MEKTMNHPNYRTLFFLALLLAFPAMACGLFDGTASGEPPRDAAIVEVMANTSLTPWLETAVADFNAAKIETSDGSQAFAILNPVESGQAISVLANDPTSATLWIPDDVVWKDLLADQGNNNFSADCISVAESPLVIGMWRPVAESLGWPGLPIGWLDIGSLAADPQAWSYYSGGEYGDALRMSHAHPGLAGSGTSTLLAVVQAAQSKSDAVTTADIAQPIVQASVGAFESAVSAFNPSTDNLGRIMSERGPNYLGAAVMYESTVIQHGNDEIVPIYPLEGTFMATHPACLNQAVDAKTQEAAELFRDSLLSELIQQTALDFGLRPVNDSIPLGPPLDAGHGVDTTQPETIFEPPSVDAVYAIQDLWQAARKPVNIVMLLDTSGSMRGSKLESMKEAAIQFVEQMGDEDTLSLIEFYSESALLVNKAQVGSEKQRIMNVIANMEPGGDTTLFDAIGDGGSVVAATTSPDSSNAMVVLTDGQDTASTRFQFDDRLISTATANDTTVFTIAYGNDADDNILSELASRGNGNFYQGDEASIAAIYEEMSAAFGGSLGIGR